MIRLPFFTRLSIRLTIAFLFAAILGVALVAVLTYRSTSSDFSSFLSHVETMERMMSGGMMGGSVFTQAGSDFLDNLGQTLWIAGLSGGALAIFLGYLFTRQIVAPLGKVTVAARQVAEGNLEQKVDIRGSGELAELGESFNLMAATLSHDQQLRRNMVADIAHELRTPLSILQGNIEAMLDGVLETNTDNLTSIHQETLLLARLVDDLRTLSLADSGQLKFQPETTDLRNVAQQVIDGFQTQLAAKKVSLALEAPNDLPQAWVDPDRTAQVLRNLLSNACHYTPEGGNITIRLTADDDGITVLVADTGVGIPPEDLPYVFDRFYRVDRSRTRATGGSGLGLTIVKQLVEAQNGRVWAESTEGKGSIFSFRVPYPPR
ncbi:MAG: HAMP domain-containing protein [Chloroflexi bacterium]|nr:HAMP domain-containing protein [Chloroflexota bacterium]